MEGSTQAALPYHPADRPHRNYMPSSPVQLLLLAGASLAVAVSISAMVASRYACPTACNAPPALKKRGQLALQESFGLFDYPEELWRRQKRVVARQSGRLSKVSSPSHGPAFFQENWEPVISCLLEERLGKPGDGGKWVCNAEALASHESCVVYSVGSNGDFSFEAGIHEINPLCEIHTFDHTVAIEVMQKVPKWLKFHSVGLGAYDTGNIKTLPSIRKMLGHEGRWVFLRTWRSFPAPACNDNPLSRRAIDILKVDCEGCGFGLDVGAAGFGQVGQILVEIHFSFLQPDVAPTKTHALFEAFQRSVASSRKPVPSDHRLTQPSPALAQERIPGLPQGAQHPVLGRSLHRVRLGQGRRQPHDFPGSPRCLAFIINTCKKTCSNSPLAKRARYTCMLLSSGGCSRERFLPCARSAYTQQLRPAHPRRGSGVCTRFPSRNAPGAHPSPIGIHQQKTACTAPAPRQRQPLRSRSAPTRVNTANSPALVSYFAENTPLPRAHLCSSTKISRRRVRTTVDMFVAPSGLGTHSKLHIGTCISAATPPWV